MTALFRPLQASLRFKTVWGRIFQTDKISDTLPLLFLILWAAWELSSCSAFSP